MVAGIPAGVTTTSPRIEYPKTPVHKVEREKGDGRETGAVKQLEQQVREMQVAEAGGRNPLDFSVVSHKPAAETVRAGAGAVANPFNLGEMAKTIDVLNAQIAAFGLSSGMVTSSGLVKAEKDSQSGGKKDGEQKGFVAAHKDLVDARYEKAEGEKSPLNFMA